MAGPLIPQGGQIAPLPADRGSRLAEKVGLALLFMMLVTPIIFQSFKALLLGVLAFLLAASALNLIKERKATEILCGQPAIWTLVIIAANFFFMLMGIINNGPGAVRGMTVYVLWPIVFTCIALAITEPNTIFRMIRTMLWGSVAVSFYILLYIASSVGYLPDYVGFDLYEDTETRSAVAISGGFMAYSIFPMNSLVFLCPLSIGIFCLSRREENLRSFHALALSAAILSSLCIILSGRVALYFSFIFSTAYWLLVPVIARSRARGGVRILHILSFPALVAVGFILADWFDVVLIESFYERIVDKVNFFDLRHVSTRERHEQFYSLLAGWWQSPIWGHGHGTVAGIVRTDTQPWAYELVYVALLFHTGILGFGLYFAWYGWCIATAVKVVREKSSMSGISHATLVAFILFLLANSSNPYMDKFDYIWIPYFVIAIVNVSESVRKSSAWPGGSQ